jgi:phosphoribosylformylglycinamidine (FGAM) synthase-like amidotransferase family enzyme
MTKPNALILNAPGINCNEETGFALEQAGASTEQVHISQLYSGEKSWEDYQILALSGGFSYGDDIAAGRILGTELRMRHGEQLDRFVNAGKAVVGICNGMQVMVETGIIPDGRVRSEGQPKHATLTVSNKQGNALGMMPHPERFVIPQQHYNWHRGQGFRPYGSQIMKNIVNYAKEI